MNDLTHISTPETDAFKLKAVSGYPSHCCDFAGDLERRLTVAREALAGLDRELKRQGFTMGGNLRIMTINALPLTAPKP